MEIKYTFLTMDNNGVQHSIAHELEYDQVAKFLEILMKGEDPNKLQDFVIRPVIKK